MSKKNKFNRTGGLLLAIMLAFFISAGFSYPLLSSAADIPIPVYPGNFSQTTPFTDPPLAVPHFTWQGVSWAETYRLQVDSEMSFHPPIFLDVTTQNVSYTPRQISELLPDGEWCWRVRVELPIPASNWSQVMCFSKSWASMENKPALIAPATGETITFFNQPIFSWSPVIGAARYLFQIAGTSGGFDAPIVEVNTLSTTHQPVFQLENGEYFWRVIPLNIANQAGRVSSVRSFILSYGTQETGMVPSQLTPEDESFPPLTPTFRWTAVEGAEFYRLEYTAHPDCDFSSSSLVNTMATTFTPTDTLPTGARYCWRVRAETSSVPGEWSSTWHFQRTWNFTPLLLTPTDDYSTGLYPLYSWTPVPGASHYLIQVSLDPDFSTLYEESLTANTTYAPQQQYPANVHYWWKVIPIDAGGNHGASSDVFDFQSLNKSIAPIMVYPYYYYQPGTFGDLVIDPREDRTAAHPLFIWQRVIKPEPDGGLIADAYRIQVDDSEAFNTPEWQHDTENTHAAPSMENDFLPIPGMDYFWRVCPLDSLGGDCLVNPATGLVWWSQVWKARFDHSLQLPPTNTSAPVLLRPESASEIVESTPLFEWFPLQAATSYQIQVSRDADFSTSVISGTSSIPAFSPSQSLAQRSLGRTEYGTFYWHVRGYIYGEWGEWSDAWRFQIASQSEWRYNRAAGNPYNQLLIGTDPISDTLPAFDLTTLFASQSSTDWIFGFNTVMTSTDMTYILYLDMDHIDGSGAVAPPERPYTVTTIPAHQPEFAVFVDSFAGVVDGDHTWVFAWNGVTWEPGQRLSDVNGLVYTSPGFIELHLPNQVIGMDEYSSISLMLFSLDNTTGMMQDSVPFDENVPGSSQVSRFSAVSDRTNLVRPASNATGDPRGLSSIPPFYWDWPTGGDGANPFAGIVLEVDLDPDFTPPHEAIFQTSSMNPYLSQNNATFLTDITGDGSYYWHARPKYWLGGHPVVLGAWSEGWSFTKDGFTAQNLSVSAVSTAPTFSWSMPEGAQSYRLQVAHDDNFSNIAIDLVTHSNSYTPQVMLEPGNYYWRVGVNRHGNIENGWSQVAQVMVALPVPTGLSPDGSQVPYAPTMCWDPVVVHEQGEPVFTAWKYRMQTSLDPGFNSIIDDVTTYNTCWSPTGGYEDGSYYWHVAMVDGSGNLSGYSPAASFTKQYPAPELLNPVSGIISQTPLFSWAPVDGAAVYRFEASLFPGFAPLYDAAQTIHIRHAPINPYAEDKLYFWRVWIVDDDGLRGPVSETSFFLSAEKYTFIPLMLR